MKKIAIQGIAGSFHEHAAKLYFPQEEIEILPCDSFKEVFAELRTDADLVGIVAIENTIAGSLLGNYDLIKNSRLQIVGEHKLRIRHCICALPGQSLDSLTEVTSHPIALMQCQDFLDRHPNLRAIEGDDTAASAQRIAQTKQRGVAAICSVYAANLYGLEVLEEGIETNKHNFTRFLVLAGGEQALLLGNEQGMNKSSLVLSVPHASGALSKVLTILSFYDINLSKIQSLPIIGREWEYQFYIDLCYTDFNRYRQSIDAIRPLTSHLQILGEYTEGEQTV
jgi:prephenate dehydratase